jgi:hypothetical protein
MKNIKLVVKENLIKRFQLQESVNMILLEENDNKKFNMTIHHLGKLIDEGYNEDQLHQHLDEQFDWLRNLFGGGNSNAKDIANHNAVLQTGTTSAWNQLKQWGIRKFLGALGLDPEGPMAYAISTAFTDMSLMDIISVFRDRQGCISHSDNVARGVIDGAVAAMRADAGPNTVFGNFLQNAVSQTLYDKGMFRKIGTSVCNMVYGKSSKSLLPKKAQQAIETPTTNTTSKTVKSPTDDDYQFKPDFSKDTSPLS